MNLKKQAPSIYPNSIQFYRKKRHFRLVDVARLMGTTSAANITRYEKGGKLPTLVNLLKLAAVLKCPPECLYTDLYKAIRSEVMERKRRYNLFERYD